MLETKINLIISSFTAILFSITAFYYIFNNIVKNIRKNKTANNKIREEPAIINECNIIPPSILRIKDGIIDLDSICRMVLVKDTDINKINICISLNNGNHTNIFLKDLNLIYTINEYRNNNTEYKLLVPNFIGMNFTNPEKQYSKIKEFENLFNYLVRCKSLRKLYLETKEKIFYSEYSFETMFKDIYFLDLERKVNNIIYQNKYKVITNSTYGISSNGFEYMEKFTKCKDNKIHYIEDAE